MTRRRDVPYDAFGDYPPERTNTMSDQPPTEPPPDEPEPDPAPGGDADPDDIEG